MRDDVSGFCGETRAASARTGKWQILFTNALFLWSEVRDQTPTNITIGCFDLTMGLDGTNIYFLFGCQVWPVFEVWYCWDGRTTSVCSAPCSILRQCQGTTAICWKMWPPNKLPKFHIRPQISYQTKKRGKKSPSIFESTGMCFVTRPSSAVARTDHSRALMLIF